LNGFLDRNFKLYQGVGGVMKKLFYLIILSLLLFSCATSIPVSVMKPAEVNMSDAKKIAVMEVSYPAKGKKVTGNNAFELIISAYQAVKAGVGDPVQSNIANYSRDKILLTLINTAYFEVISNTQVDALLGESAGRVDPKTMNEKLGAQAIIIAELVKMNEEFKDGYEKVMVAQDKFEDRYYAERSCSIELIYRVIDARTGSVIAVRTLTGKSSDKQDARNKLKNEETLYRTIIDQIIPPMGRQLAPYRVTEYRVLMKDKTKDERMKQADAFVKGGMYQDAFNLFMRIYNENGNIAAGFNAGICIELMGDLDRAIEFMANLARRSPEQRIFSEMDRMKRTKKEREAVEMQLK
jgi:hypothetical protein